MIVCKFGGTSVQDAEAISRLVEIVQARARAHPLVVVSAMAGVTDDLLRLVPLVESGQRTGLKAGLNALVHRHGAVAAQLPGAGVVVERIRESAGRLHGRLRGPAGRPLSPRLRDMLVGHGELWSAWLVSAAIEGAGCAARWVDAREMVITDNRFTRAAPIMPELTARARAHLLPLLESGVVPVTQGFVGSTLTGIPTTLGRGGSDFTASLLGAALGVKRVEIWTDVNGLMTADPRIVPEARTLPGASYDEAAELASFGAKVLHPATQLPLAQAGIPIAILNSRFPDGPGTTIEPDAKLARPGNSPVRSISWKKGITVLNLKAPRMLGASGFLRSLFEVFERHGVVVDVLASSEVSVSLTIEDRSHMEALVRDLAPLGEVTVTGGHAIIAVVGIGLRTTPGLPGRVFSAVGPTNVEMISQGASEINMTFVVAEKDGPDVVRRLHRELLECA